MSDEPGAAETDSIEPGDWIARGAIAIKRFLRSLRPHTKLLGGLLCAVLAAIGTGLWIKVDNASRRELKDHWLRSALERLPGAKYGRRHLGSPEPDERLTARAYFELELHYEFPRGTLARELPAFAKRMLLSPGGHEGYGIYAAYACGQLAACEKLALAARDKSIAFWERPTEGAIQLQVLAAWSAREQHQSGRALDHLRAAATMTDDGIGQIQKVGILEQTSALLYEMGRHEEGLAVARDALQLSRKIHFDSNGTGRPNHDHLAPLLTAAGDLAEAERLFRQQLAWWGPRSEYWNWRTLPAVNSLAGFLHAKGDLTEAESLYRQALKTLDRQRNRKSPTPLVHANIMALSLRDKGDLFWADQLKPRKLVFGKRPPPPDHPDLLFTIFHLSRLLRDRGDLAGAEPLAVRAVEGFSVQFGPASHSTKNAQQLLDSIRRERAAKGFGK